MFWYFFMASKGFINYNFISITILLHEQTTYLKPISCRTLFNNRREFHLRGQKHGPVCLPGATWVSWKVYQRNFLWMPFVFESSELLGNSMEETALRIVLKTYMIKISDKNHSKKFNLQNICTQVDCCRARSCYYDLSTSSSANWFLLAYYLKDPHHLLQLCWNKFDTCATKLLSPIVYGPQCFRLDLYSCLPALWRFVRAQCDLTACAACAGV